MLLKKTKVMLYLTDIIIKVKSPYDSKCYTLIFGRLVSLRIQNRMCSFVLR